MKNKLSRMHILFASLVSKEIISRAEILLSQKIAHESLHERLTSVCVSLEKVLLLKKKINCSAPSSVFSSLVIFASIF